MGFVGLGKGDLRICSFWLLIFDFVSVIYLLYDLWEKKEEEIRYLFIVFKMYGERDYILGL